MRKLMWMTIGFGVSCGLCAYLPDDTWHLPFAVISCILLIASIWIACRCKIVRCAAFAFAGVVLGLIWFSLFHRYYLFPVISMDGEQASLTVTATDYSYDTLYGVAVDGRVTLDGKPYQIRVYVNENTQIHPGDTIRGLFKLRYTPPGGKEEATYHAGKGIFFLGYERKDSARIHAAKLEAHYQGAVLAHSIGNLLGDIFPEEEASFAKALLLGDSSDLDYSVDTAFKLSGIRHIIAVSGLHVAILYSVISVITFRKRFLTALLAGPVLFLFAAAAGFTPSVTRACIMVGLMILAQLFNRDYDSPTALSFAALVMLVWNPMVITSVSFQLSVGCVAGILLFQPKISNWLKSILGNPKGKSIRAKLKRGFISSVSVTISAMSLTTPLSAYYFGAVSLVGLLTNLLTLWVVSFVFTGLAAMCAVSLISVTAARWLGKLLTYGIRYILTVAKTLGSFPLAAVYTKSVYIVIWLVFVYVLLAVFLISRKKRPEMLVCCAVIGLCGALFLSWMEPLRDDVRMTVLDVGQGQSIILQSEGKTFLVDCGGDNDEMTADLAAETLLSQGVFRLDGLILTHGDRDHAGGAANLLSRITTDVVMLPSTTGSELTDTLDESTDGQVIPVSKNYSISFGETEITVFGPTFAANGNENSLCVLFSGKNCDILITGDRGALGEQLLLAEGELPQVDVLIAGHHGSKSATSEELLTAVQAEIVIISVGEDNPYGHPSDAVLDRLEDFGCRVYRTDEEGTIIFRR